jgi:hypothetical protein
MNKALARLVSLDKGGPSFDIKKKRNVILGRKSAKDHVDCAVSDNKGTSLTSSAKEGRFCITWETMGLVIIHMTNL